MTRTALALLLVLSACASSSSRAIVGPDGRTSYRLKCHPDIDGCWEEAGDVCGARGYVVLDQNMHWGGTVADAMPGPVTWYTVLVRCR